MDATNSVKTTSSASPSANKETKKQKEGSTCICPICLNVTKEADNTTMVMMPSFVKVVVTYGNTVSVQA